MINNRTKLNDKETIGKLENFTVDYLMNKSLLDAYKESVEMNYHSERAIKTLMKFSGLDGEEITGSNPFMLVKLQDSELLPKNFRIATRQDLEKAISKDKNIFSGSYVDFGLALRTAGDSYSPNYLLSKILAEELKSRGIKLGKGKLIPISALELKEDSNSSYGLVFNLKEDVKELEDLSQFKWNYEKSQGLARAYLIKCGKWSSLIKYVGISNGNGKVVVVQDLKGENSIK